MDAKKIEKLLAPEKPRNTVRVTLNVKADVYERMKARYPRNRRPSLSEVTETLWSQFLDEVGKKK